MTESDGAAGFLKGVTVLEVGDGIAGGAAGSVLASLGADVIVLPRRDATVHRLRPSAPGGSGESMLAVLLQAGKRVLDPVAAVDACLFDVVIEDRCDGGGPTGASGPDEFTARGGTGSWVTISPFGLSGPKRDWLGSDLTIGASGGLLSGVTDATSGRPLKMAGNQACLIAGHAGALATCHGLDLARRLGRPVQIDVSAQEAAIAMGPVLGIAQVMMGCTGAGGAGRFGGPTGLFRCRDGYVQIMAMEDHQWQALVAALGSPEWAEKFRDPALRITRATEVNERLEERLADWGKEETEERLQAAGVPTTAMYGPDELIGVPQFHARGSMRVVEWEGASVLAVKSPFRIDATGPAAASPRGIAGLAVAEMGHVLAVPLAGALLGAMGARVTKLEDPDRLDMYRRGGPYVEGSEGLEGSAYFAYMNHSKASVLVKTDDADQMAAATANADVVIENMGPRRARRVGVDAAGLFARRPGTLSVSSSGYGHTGPWSGYRVYAYNVQTCCGLAYLTRTVSGEPPQIDIAWADLISGYALATAIAAWAVGPKGPQGAAVDFSMVELAVSRFNEFLAATSLPEQTVLDDPHAPLDSAAPFSPQGIYRTAIDGQWIALSVGSDEQWAAFRKAVGDPVALREADLRTAPSRFAHQFELNRIIDDHLSLFRPDEIEHLLHESAVPAAVVASAGQLAHDRHLEEREFFREVEHPLWGRRRLVGLPWRLAGEKPFDLGPPPQLGNAGSFSNPASVSSDTSNSAAYGRTVRSN